MNAIAGMSSKQPHEPMSDDASQKIICGIRDSLIKRCCCRYHAARLAQMIFASFILDYCDDDVLQMGRLLQKRKEKFVGKVGCVRDKREAET